VTKPGGDDAAVRAGRAASLRERLFALAKARGEDFNLLLNRYGTERLLYRLSISPLRDKFVLKGALLFDLWFSVPHRPTRDADLLGFGPADADVLTAAARSLCAIEADDGMAYDAASVRTDAIRGDANSGGLRVTLVGALGRARCTVQVDVGYGDVVTPAAQETELPSLLPQVQAVRLRAYPRETVVAEKLEALTVLGLDNSRMKDYFDLHALMREGRTEANLMVQAIAATFARRGTALPLSLPVGLSAEFSNAPTKRAQWAAFLRKNRLEAQDLALVVGEIGAWLAPVLDRARGEPR
jgi:hypothetical protein